MAAVEAVAEEVATNLEEIAEVTRRINASGIGYFGAGLTVGAVAGLYFGRRIMKKKLTAEIYAEAEEEIEQIREVYQAKVIAHEPKPDLDEMAHELGYVTPAPVFPPPRPLPAPVPVSDPLQKVNSPSGHINYGGHTGGDTVEAEVKLTISTDSVDEESEEAQTAPVVRPPWDYGREIDSRTPTAPYVIHQDEFINSEHEYDKVEYTYYDVDDVVADEENRPIPNADDVVGLHNLKWGHGADDPDSVYIRNDRLSIEISLRRLDRSYEEDVLGHDVDQN